MKQITMPLKIVVLSTIICTGCVVRNWTSDVSHLSGNKVRAMAQARLDQRNDEASGDLVIASPLDGAVFPPEIAAPTLQWQDATPGVRCWVVTVESDGVEPICHITRDPFWEPDRDTWEIIKERSVQAPSRVTVFGMKTPDAPVAVSHHSIRISISEDPLDARILFRQVPLPFMIGERNFRKIRWRIGDVSEYGEPRLVMQDIPVCASCHQVTADGGTISMEMNYGNDSGAQFIAGVSENIVLKTADFMTWSDFPKPEILPNTRGLFARMSPSGRFVVSTVNEISYAALTNEPEYCQLFFPTYGILASYSVESRTFMPLKGADNRNVIQTNPAWSPDEAQIVFARSETKNEYHESITDIRTHIESCGIEELNRRFPIRFDLWKVPFNAGNGGEAEPLIGASENGMSNYFPRFSPDGKWIVYTRSPTGIMLQPDSALFIVPSEGGVERRMTCNRGRFNSWHSWSPNGKWLLFSSKETSIYTQIWLTHIDDQGNDSPPVCLSRFSDDKLAANLPECVTMAAGRLKTIRLDDE